MENDRQVLQKTEFLELYSTSLFFKLQIDFKS